MNIGFDAKRAYHNGTGLGHYSRTLIKLLAEHYPQHQFFLFNPRKASLFSFNHPSIHEVRPTGILPRLLPSAWRSSWVKSDLAKHQIQLYHGLSHEIPVGISRTATRSIVTMHDLIHERYPEQYSAVDVKIYSKKFRYACAHADHIIAISQQTRNDLIEFYHTDPARISVCYQSCSPAFASRASESELSRIRKKYDLPPEFFLYVGSIIERKNLLNVCKAMFLLRKETQVPLVVIGQGGKYKQQVLDFLRQHDLVQRVIFLSDSPEATDPAFRTGEDLPAIYQSAIALIYPSFFEGFGIPVLEALWSGLPVITSNVSCLPEAGGDAALYVHPGSAEEIASAMMRIHTDAPLADEMIQKGLRHAQSFAPDTYAKNIMDIYKMVC